MNKVIEAFLMVVVACLVLAAVGYLAACAAAGCWVKLRGWLLLRPHRRRGDAPEDRLRNRPND